MKHCFERVNPLSWTKLKKKWCFGLSPPEYYLKAIREGKHVVLKTDFAGWLFGLRASITQRLLDQCGVGLRNFAASIGQVLNNVSSICVGLAGELTLTCLVLSLFFQGFSQSKGVGRSHHWNQWLRRRTQLVPLLSWQGLFRLYRILLLWQLEFILGVLEMFFICVICRSRYLYHEELCMNVV